MDTREGGRPVAGPAGLTPVAPGRVRLGSGVGRGRWTRRGQLRAGAALLAFPLGACATGAPGGAGGSGGGTAGPGAAQAVTLSFMGWGQPSEIQIFETLIAKYKERQPRTAVDYQKTTPAEFPTKLTAAQAADQVPDVFYMPDGTFGSWITSGVMQAIDGYVDRREVEKIWPKGVARYRFDGSTIGQGKIYCLPKDLGPWVMVYNQDLFDRYSIPYPKADGSWTWDVALEAWRRMTKIGADGTPETFGVGDFTLEAAVWSNGVDYLNAERTRVTVDDPRFVEAFQFVADLRLRHKVSPDQEQRAALNTFERWKAGQLGTHVMGPWDQPSFWQLPFRWDIAPFPTSPRTKRPASWTGSVGFGVSAKTKHPREAVDLTRFFATDEDGQRTNYQLGQAVPNLISMAKGEFLKFEKPPASKQVFLDNLETWGRPTLGWYTSNDDWLALFNTEAGAVYRGEITADAWSRQHAPALTTELTKQAQLPSVLP